MSENRGWDFLTHTEDNNQVHNNNIDLYFNIIT